MDLWVIEAVDIRLAFCLLYAHLSTDDEWSDGQVEMPQSVAIGTIAFVAGDVHRSDKASFTDTGNCYDIKSDVINSPPSEG